MLLAAAGRPSCAESLVDDCAESVGPDASELDARCGFIVCGLLALWARSWFNLNTALDKKVAGPGDLSENAGTACRPTGGLADIGCWAAPAFDAAFPPDVLEGLAAFCANAAFKSRKM